MKMDRFFTGLVALVAGLALSAGSAYATAGYTMGNASPMKLVPHYEIGDSKATIIGVQNMMSGDNDTHECQVAADASATAGPLPNANAARICRVDFDQDDRTDPMLPSVDQTDAGNVNILGGGVVTPAQQLAMANAQANGDDATNLIVTVIAYGPSGNEQGSTKICLAEGAFGYVALGKMDMDMDMDDPSIGMLSMANGLGVDGTMESKDDAGRTIIEPMPAYTGYVTVTASHRVVHCDGTPTPSDEAVRITTPSDPTYLTNATPPVATTDATQNASRDRYIANPAIAAWTIVQDIGSGFFGVEVPTPTVSVMRGENKVIQAANQTLDCYDIDNDGTNASVNAGSTQAADTEWNMMKCGLIPERHNNDRIKIGPATPTVNDEDVGALYMAGDPDTRGLATATVDDNTVAGAAGYATPLAKATVRYDADDETTVFVWLGAKGTMLDIGVRCEEGMAAAIDDPSLEGMDTELPVATVMVPGMTKMIDPSMGEVGSFVEQCAGSRGVLEITMPDGSGAGMVWSHITQMGGHYRMNFPGYSMANPTACRVMVADSADDNDEKARIDMCL